MISGPDSESPKADWREDFPLGDGTAETGATVYCPYCNETVEIAIDRNRQGSEPVRLTTLRFCGGRAP